MPDILAPERLSEQAIADYQSMIGRDGAEWAYSSQDAIITAANRQNAARQKLKGAIVGDDAGAIEKARADFIRATLVSDIAQKRKGNPYAGQFSGGDKARITETAKTIVTPDGLYKSGLGKGSDVDLVKKADIGSAALQGGAPNPFNLSPDAAAVPLVPQDAVAPLQAAAGPSKSGQEQVTKLLKAAADAEHAENTARTVQQAEDFIARTINDALKPHVEARQEDDDAAFREMLKNTKLNASRHDTAADADEAAFREVLKQPFRPLSARAPEVHLKGGVLGAAVAVATAGAALVNGATASEAATIAKDTVIENAVPGLSTGFDNLTKKQGVVDRILNWADTGTATVATAATGVAVAAGTTAVVTSPLALTGAGASVPAGAATTAAGAAVVAGLAGAANLGVGLISDVTYSAGLSQKSGPVHGLFSLAGAYVHGVEHRWGWDHSGQPEKPAPAAAPDDASDKKGFDYKGRDGSARVALKPKNTGVDAPKVAAEGTPAVTAFDAKRKPQTAVVAM